MLVRAFRVIDRLGNAALRVTAWTALVAVEQATLLKQGLIGIFASIVGLFALAFRATTGAPTVTAKTVVGSPDAALDGVGGGQLSPIARQQQRMAQKAAEAEMKAKIVRDPLLAQNRALSAFAVLLLLILLAVIVLQNSDDNGNVPLSSGGIWPQAENTRVPTAIFPTEEPSPTPIPDPLRVGGSIVFALRQGGQMDLWAISVGESAPLRLTNSPADERDPAWSPDGTKIAFASNREGNWELYILEIGTGTISRLTYTPGFEGAPTWSPDGAFLAYEGYNEETQDLDIYIINSDPARAASEGALRATFTAGPDIEPDWAPGGRQIAFTSWRTGNQEIFVLSLDADGGDAQAVNMTNTANINENYPTWNGDGSQIAYSAVVDGVEGVYVTGGQSNTGSAILVGRGRMPSWAPNNGSIAYMLDVGQITKKTQILAGSIGNFGAATDAIALDHTAADPDWAATSLPAQFVASGGVPANADVAAPLYTEVENRKSDGLFGMALLNGVDAPQAYLSDRVNESFAAMRLRVLEKAGYDFFGTLEDAFWHRDRPPEPGEPTENWHYAGRAIAFDRDLIYASNPIPVEVVRENAEVNTYWRVYVRVVGDAQNGTLGEPLRTMPWDFTARGSGNVEDYERGGRIKNAVPAGYYVDITEITQDYGWERLPAQRTWQSNFSAIQFWVFIKTDGIAWADAMRELYTPEEVENFFVAATAVPAPLPLPTASPTPSAFSTATPIPPDQQ